MSILEETDQKSIEFWDDIGSGIIKEDGEDNEEWMKRVAITAWHNGFYHGRYTIGYDDIMKHIKSQKCENCIYHKDNGFCKRIEIGTLDGFSCTYWETK